MVCWEANHYQGISDRWDNVWGPLLKPMGYMGLKKVEYGWKQRVTQTMGETGPESEDPLALNSEPHFLCCAGVAGFGDKRQNVARELCQECGWEGRNVVLGVSWDPCSGYHESVHKAFHGGFVLFGLHIVDRRSCTWDSRPSCDFCSKLGFWRGSFA